MFVVNRHSELEQNLDQFKAGFDGDFDVDLDPVSEQREAMEMAGPTVTTVTLTTTISITTTAK